MAIAPQARETLGKIFDEPLLLAQILGYDKVVHPIHRSWIVEPWVAGKDTLLLAHRNSYKTTCRVISVIWGLLFWPETRIFFIRKSGEDASKIVGEIMQHYARENLRRIYSAIGVSEPRNLETWSTHNFSLSTKTKVTKERGVECAGVGKPKVGNHHDLIFPDDIVTLEDRYYRAERERTKVFTRELQNILTPKSRGIHYSGTPWHENDAWTTIGKRTTTRKFPVTMKFIPDLTDARLEEIRSVLTQSEFEANYYLRHIAEGDRIFREPHFGETPENEPVYGYLDSAFTEEKKNDHTALCFGAVKDGLLYIPGGYTWQRQLDETYSRVKELYDLHGCIVLYVESNGGQIAVVNALRGMGIKAVAVNNSKNKHFRINHYAVRRWKKIRFAEAMKDGEFLKQILDYQPGVTADDAPDGLAGLAAQFLTHSNRGIQVAEVEV